MPIPNLFTPGITTSTCCAGAIVSGMSHRHHAPDDATPKWTVTLWLSLNGLWVRVLSSQSLKRQMYMPIVSACAGDCGESSPEQMTFHGALPYLYLQCSAQVKGRCCWVDNVLTLTMNVDPTLLVPTLYSLSCDVTERPAVSSWQGCSQMWSGLITIKINN